MIATRLGVMLFYKQHTVRIEPAFTTKKGAAKGDLLAAPSFQGRHIDGITDATVSHARSGKPVAQQNS